MGIAIRCDHCRRALTAGEQLAGKGVKCPGCGNAIRVPHPLDDLEVIPDQPRSPAVRRAPRQSSVPLLAAAAVLLLGAGIGVGLLLNRAGNPPVDSDTVAAKHVDDVPSEAPAADETVAAPREESRAAPQAPPSSSPSPVPAADSESDLEPAANDPPANNPTASDPPANNPPASDPPSDLRVSSAPPSSDPASSTDSGSGAVGQQETSPEETEAPPAETDNVIRFAPLALEEPASTMAMSENGQYLFVAHEASGTVVVWDVAGDSVAATIATESPRALLSRGDILYVANHGKGTISLFDGGQGWQLSRMVDLDHDGIVHLSAPGGGNFSSTLLATCHGEGVQASYQETHIYLVDTRRGRAEEIRKDSLATCSQDGKFVITQGSFNLSPSGGIAAYPFGAYRRPDAQPTMRGGVTQTPFVYQVHPGTWWIATNQLFAAPQFNRVHDEVGRVIVPDLSRKVIYALTDRSLTAHQLNVALTELDSRRVELPAAQSEDISRIDHFLYRHREYRLDHPVAWTNGGQLDLYVLDLDTGEVLHGRTEGFALPESSSASRRPRVADAESSASGSPAAAPANATPEVLAGIPELMTEGRQVDHRFRNPGGQLKFSLVTGPEGITVTEEGQFRWRPGSDDIGRHRLRIRVIDGSEPFLEEPEIQVVPKSLAEAVDGDLARLQPAVMELDLDPALLRPSHDGESLILVQGNSLRQLESDGFTVTDSHRLPNRYQHFDIRNDEYVGVTEGTHTLEVLDARSLRVKKQVDLASLGHRVLEVTDLAAHPTRSMSYVGIKRGVDVPRYLVLPVNEKSGRIDGDPLLGTWAAIDAAGGELITGYRDLYRNGSNFHINSNWDILMTPKYGNIDMLIRYEVGRGQPTMRQIVYEAGGNGSGIRLSPDGRRVSYLSAVGYPKHSKKLPGFNVADLEQPSASYAAPDGETPSDLAFHPTFPIVAVTSGNNVALLNRKNGQEMKNRFHLLEGALDDVEIERLIFSPDGNALLLLAPGGPTGRQMLKVNLDLSGLKANRVPASRPRGRSEPKKDTKPQRAPNNLQGLGKGV